MSKSIITIHIFSELQNLFLSSRIKRTHPFGVEHCHTQQPSSIHRSSCQTLSHAKCRTASAFPSAGFSLLHSLIRHRQWCNHRIIVQTFLNCSCALSSLYRPASENTPSKQANNQLYYYYCYYYYAVNTISEVRNEKGKCVRLFWEHCKWINKVIPLKLR